MNLTYTVETKDWNNDDSYPTFYKGESLIIAMAHFKEQHLKGEDVVLFIEDKQGNLLDTITNYNNTRNDVIHCNDFITPNDTELKKEHKEAVNQKEIYINIYHEQLNNNDQLKKENDRLQSQIRQQHQELNKMKDDATLQSNTKQSNNKITNDNTNTIHWYQYRLRGFSPFCQPKGHIEVNHEIGRHGAIAYDRQLTQKEIDEYELMPINHSQLNKVG
jgi:hypothetical protein